MSGATAKGDSEPTTGSADAAGVVFDAVRRVDRRRGCAVVSLEGLSERSLFFFAISGIHRGVTERRHAPREPHRLTILDRNADRVSGRSPAGCTSVAAAFGSTPPLSCQRGCGAGPRARTMAPGRENVSVRFASADERCGDSPGGWTLIPIGCGSPTTSGSSLVRIT